MTTTATGTSRGDDLEGLGAALACDGDLHTAVPWVNDPGLREVLDRFDHAALAVPLLALRGLGGLRREAGLVSDLVEEAWVGSCPVVPAFDPVLTDAAVVTLALRYGVPVPLEMHFLRTLPWDDEAPPAAAEPEDVRATDDAVTVVESLKGRLGVSRALVLEAAGISTSTFHTWTKDHAPRPRLASQGRLWELVEVVDGIEAVLQGPVRGWLLASGSRVERLRAGDLDSLAAEASSASMPTGPVAPAYAAAYAVGGGQDPAADNFEDVPTVRPRRLAAATSGQRRRRT